MGRLRAQTLAISALTEAARDRMWALFEADYADVSRERFEADLAAKDHVFLMSSDGLIQGFSTVAVLKVEVAGRKVVAIYSGDTVIAEAHRGDTALQGAFFRYIMSVRLRYPTRPVLWFLISKGYKTYLLMARNFPRCWPRRGQEMPVFYVGVLDALARQKFGRAWRPVEGLLVFDAPQGRLRAGVASPEGVDDPDVRFFVERNPGWAQGDELCCLGVIDARLALSYPLKFLRKRRKQAIKVAQ